MILNKKTTMAFTPEDLMLAITKATEYFAARTNKPTDEYIVDIRKVLTTY